MKKFILFCLIISGLWAEGADYNSIKDLVLDTENAEEKIINYDGQYTGLHSSYDWHSRKRPYMSVSSLEDSWSYLAIFFNKKFNERIKKLERRQLINVTCRVKKIGILKKCELIDFTLIKK